MKKTVTEWQQDISQAANQKFPNNKDWSQYDRIASIQRQLDDVLSAIKVEDGSIQSDHHAHQDPDHRIAALVADILILGEMRKADIEGELERVLDWFNSDQ